MSSSEFISSGLIEAYVLGAASPEEQREVERMAAQYPDVAKALELAQNDLEAYVQLYAEQPSEQLREKVLSAISEQETPRRDPKVIPINRPAKSSLSIGRAAAAAIVILLVSSVSFNVYLFTDMRGSQKEMAAAQEQLKKSLDSAQQQYASLRDSSAARFASLSNEHRKTLDALATFKNPTTLVMASVKTDAAEAKAKIYWCSQTHMVCVDPMTLPGAPAGKQFELWAIVDGKPVSVGLFNAGNGADLQMMGVVPKAEAFAVTLEKEGGVPAPEGPMYVMASL